MSVNTNSDVEYIFFKWSDIMAQLADDSLVYTVLTQLWKRPHTGPVPWVNR